MNPELAYNFLKNPKEFQTQFERVLERTPNCGSPSYVEFWIEFFRSVGVTIRNSQIGKDLNIQDVCFSVGDNSGDRKILKLAFKINDRGNDKVILRSIAVTSSERDDILKSSQYSRQEIKVIKNRLETDINLSTVDSQVLQISNNNIRLEKGKKRAEGSGSSGTNAANIVKVQPLQLVQGQDNNDITLDTLLDLISNPDTATQQNVAEFFDKLIDLYRQNPIPGKEHVLEAASHGFTYGLFTLLYKHKYALDTYVEHSAGKGFLDIAVVFRKMFDLDQKKIIDTDAGSRIIGEFKTGDHSVEKAVAQIKNEGYNYNLFDRSTSDKIIAVGLNFEKENSKERIKVDLDLKAYQTKNFVSEIVGARPIDETKIKDLLANLYYSIRSEEKLELVILGNILSQDNLANKKVFTINSSELNPKANTKVIIFSYKYNNENYILTITDTDVAIDAEYDGQQAQTQDLGRTRSATSAQTQTNTHSTSTTQALENVMRQIQQGEDIHNGKRIDIVVNSNTGNYKKFESLNSRDTSKDYLKGITVSDIQDVSITNPDHVTKYITYDCKEKIETYGLLLALMHNHPINSPSHQRLDIQLSSFKQILFNLKDFIAPYKEAGFKALMHGLYLENFKAEQSAGTGRADGIVKYNDKEVFLLEFKAKEHINRENVIEQGKRYIQYLKSITNLKDVPGVALNFNSGVKDAGSIITSYQLEADVQHYTTEEESSPESGKKRVSSSDSDDMALAKQIKWSECLPGPSSRAKRSDSECKFGWSDVNAFNVAEQEDRRNKDKIKIGSAKFLHHIRKTEEDDKRTQLVQFIDEIISADNTRGYGEEKIVGKFSHLVHELITNHRVINHLDKVARISGMTMHGMIGKNILVDFSHEDYEGVAINLGFIAGGQGLAKVSEMLSMQGLKLVSEGKLVFATCLRAASPFLARTTSAFVAYDLVNQVKELKAGNSDALVGVIGDSVYLTIDVAEIGVELTELFGALEGISSVTGPVGAVIGAIVFVGTDIYFAVKKVDQIDQVIHLTGWEKFKEGWRAFLGMNTEQYLQELIEEKEVNNQLVREKMQFLKQHPDIQRYVFPTGKSVVDHDDCNVEIVTIKYYPKHFAFSRGMPPIGPALEREVERTICKQKIQSDLDSIILLNEKSTNIKWSRSKPDDPSGGEIFCYPEGDYAQVPNGGAYKCKNAIGVSYSENRTCNYTIIDLGKGDDTVVGFPYSANIFLIGDGHKMIYGGNKNDLFILHGNSTVGFITGGEGDDTVDLSDFVSQAPSRVEITCMTKQITLLPTEHKTLFLQKINSIIGRKNKPDSIQSACDTKFINGQGGNIDSNQPDIIFIPSEDCFYKMHLQLTSNTAVYNNASQGNFSYNILELNSGNNRVTLQNPHPLHWFFFNYTLSQIQNIKKYDYDIIIFAFDAAGEIHIDSNDNNVFYRLKDDTEIKINGTDLYATQSSNKSVDEIIQEYPAIADKLKMFIVVKSLVNNEIVSIGHGNHEVIFNDPFHKSHLIGGQGEDIYVITSGHKKFNSDADLIIPETTIYGINASDQKDILDLRQLSWQITNDLNSKLLLSLEKDVRDILIKPFIQDHNTQYQKYITKIRLKDAFQDNWYEKLQVIVNSAPMNINYSDDELFLRATPIIFNNKTQIFIVAASEIEHNTELVIPKKAGQYSFYTNRHNTIPNNKTVCNADLILTNVFEPFDFSIEKESWYTVVLSEFYAYPDQMQTLRIQFSDKRIAFTDEVNVNDMNNAPEFFDQLKHNKRTMYSTIWDQMSGSAESQHHNNHHNRHHHGEGINARRSRAIDDDHDFVQPTSSSASRLEFAPVKWVKTMWSTLVNVVKYSDTKTSAQVTTPVPDKDYNISTEDTIIKAYIDNIVSNKGLEYSHNYTYNDTTKYSPITSVPDIKFIPDSANAHNQEYHSNGIDLSVINNSSLLLWDLGMRRMFTGVKYPANNQSIFINNNLDINDDAHRLAYSSYAPSVIENEKDIGLLGLH